jgi:putative acetyltransferase
MNVVIRQETDSDFAAVIDVNRQAFGRDDEARLVERLRKSRTFIQELSLVADLNRQIVGHILFTKIVIRSGDGNEYPSLALAPMAVLPRCQKQGIGGKLVQHGLKRAIELGHRSVIVLGHEQYYPAFGFEPASRWNISCPYDVPDNVFMAMELSEDGLKGVTGTVKYPDDFNEA